MPRHVNSEGKSEGRQSAASPKTGKPSFPRKRESTGEATLPQVLDPRSSRAPPSVSRARVPCPYPVTGLGTAATLSPVTSRHFIRSASRVLPVVIELHLRYAFSPSSPASVVGQAAGLSSTWKFPKLFVVVDSRLRGNDETRPSAACRNSRASHPWWGTTPPSGKELRGYSRDWFVHPRHSHEASPRESGERESNYNNGIWEFPYKRKSSGSNRTGEGQTGRYFLVYSPHLALTEHQCVHLLHRPNACPERISRGQSLPVPQPPQPKGWV